MNHCSYNRLRPSAGRSLVPLPLRASSDNGGKRLLTFRVGNQNPKDLGSRKSTMRNERKRSGSAGPQERDQYWLKRFVSDFDTESAIYLPPPDTPATPKCGSRTDCCAASGPPARFDFWTHFCYLLTPLGTDPFGSRFRATPRRPRSDFLSLAKGLIAPRP